MGNAKQAASFYCARLGFEPYAYKVKFGRDITEKCTLRRLLTRSNVTQLIEACSAMSLVGYFQFYPTMVWDYQLKNN